MSGLRLRQPLKDGIYGNLAWNEEGAALLEWWRAYRKQHSAKAGGGCHTLRPAHPHDAEPHNISLKATP